MRFRTSIGRGPRGKERITIPAIAVIALGGSETTAVRVGINGHSVRTRVAVEDDEYVAELGAVDRLAAGVGPSDDVDVDLALDDEHGPG